MDSRGNIFDNPTPEQIKEKKLVPVTEMAKKMSRRDRRALYRKLAKKKKVSEPQFAAHDEQV